MTEHEELPRLFDQASSPLERALLAAGREPALSRSGSERRRMQVLLALGLGSSLALGSKTSLALAAGWKKLVVGGAIVASGAASVVAYQQVAEEQDAVTESEPAAAVGQRSAVRAPVAAPAEDEAAEPAVTTFQELPLAEQAQEQPQSEPARPKTAVRPKARTQRSAAKPRQPARADHIQEEVRALDTARAALRSGKPGSALSQLSSYSARFPKGSLRLEAEVLRIEAFAASGNHSEASRRAKRILNRSPNSVLAGRLRRYVLD